MNLSYSFEYVRVPDEDIIKYGVGPSQLNLIVNDVRYRWKIVFFNLFIFAVYFMQKADVLVMGVIVSHAKFLVSDPSTFILIEPFYLLVPWPKEESRILAPILPFQPPVSQPF